MENNKKKNIQNIIAIILIALLSAGIGSLVTYNVMLNNMKNVNIEQNRNFENRKFDKNFDNKQMPQELPNGEQPQDDIEPPELPNGEEPKFSNGINPPSNGENNNQEQSQNSKQNKKQKQDNKDLTNSQLSSV